MLNFDLGYYHLSPSSVPTFLTMLALLLLGSVAVIRERVSLVSVSFFLVTLSAAVWLFAMSMVYSSDGGGQALIWAKASYFGVPSIAASSYLFTVSVLGIYRRYKYIAWGIWALSAIFTAAALGSDALVAGVYSFSWGHYVKFGPLGVPFTLFVVGSFAISMAHYLLEYRASRTPRHRVRTRALMIAFGAGYIASADLIAAYGVPLYPFGYLAVLSFVVLGVRAIWKYRLVDVTPAFAAREIIATMTDGLLVLDREGLIRVANEPVCEFFGRTEDELIGTSLADRLHYTLVPGQHEVSMHDGKIEACEGPYCLIPGKNRILGLSVSLMYDKHGQVDATVCIARDITGRKRAEEKISKLNEGLENSVAERTAQLEATKQGLEAEIVDRRRSEDALRESEERYRVVTETSRDAIIALDEERNILFANSAVEETFGYSVAEVVGKPFMMLIPPAQREDHKAGLERYMSTSHAQPGWESSETAGLHKSGEVLTLEISYAGSFTGGKRIFIGTMREISDRKQAEEARLAQETAERSNRAKSEFLSRMSHELRTPLNAIIGFSQLLEMDEQDEGRKESVDLILKAGHHLLALINEVLEISRIEAGRMSLFIEPVQIADVIAECVALVRPMAAQRKLVIQSGAAGDTALRNAYVLADRQRIKQVLLNLLSNAIKYNRDGGSVTLLYSEVESGRMQIEVKDSGSGIAQEKLDRLFTPFERLDAERTGVEGTGLGLALSKGLVELMGGSIALESVVGQGSAFRVELPMAAAPLGQVKEITTRPNLALPQEPAADRTLLYIEDNLSNLLLIQHILIHRPDIKLLSAMQGSLGFDLATQHRPDLILLDLHLPDVHGDKVLRWLRDDPRTSEIPVIIISADATHHEVERLLQLGASAYITKPLDVRQFLAAVEGHLEKKLEGRTLVNAG